LFDDQNEKAAQPEDAKNRRREKKLEDKREIAM